MSFHASALDAQIAGNQAFPDGLFSIQHVVQDNEDLGFYSYAIYTAVSTAAGPQSSRPGS